ncbi:phage/plasmid primase, P4 family [Halobellus captivus]|uniref:phage/plasmid primase, P4 family n=1 Tax=Halobellus captivus TaxID=2592614 RepID=UPI0011A055AD|nr:phage/plasmid primase, P4 family [Halobellus captivus]
MTNYDAIPTELQGDQWLLWDNSADTPRRPHWDGEFYGISWSDPNDWHTFEEARDAAQPRESWGIGRVMAGENDDYEAGEYACIDVDGGITDDRTPKDWVPDLNHFEGTYIEHSASGTGLHIFVENAKIPDWWTDGQLGEHEGVDVLQNKFCAFTGQTHDLSGNSITDVNPAPWLFKAYKAIHGRTPDLGESQSQRRAGEEHEEYLTESDIEEALSYVDPDVSHTEWIKIGFAIHDFDSGSAGRKLFEEWSRRGSKYDKQASQSIDWIWSEASDGSGVTLGTLIHKAKEGGWTVPTPSKGESSRTNPHSSTAKTPLQNALAPNWFDTQNQIVRVQDTKEYESTELVDLFKDPDQLPTKATLAINETAGGAAFLENPDGWEIETRTPADPYADLSLQELKNVALREIPIERVAWLPKRQEWFWCDDDGLWHSHGEEYIRQWLDSEFQEHYRKQLRNEVVDQLKARTRAEEEAFGGGPIGTVATKSGLVNLQTGDCREIEPADKVRWRIEAEYDPEAECPRWKEFLGDVVEAADIPLLQEFVGYCLHHWSLPHKKALMLLGPTDAGKSVFIDVVEGLFGGEDSPSTASTSIQYLANQRWGPARLVNTAINTRSDLGSELIENTGKVKELIAGDSMDAERKRKPVFQFTPSAKHIFAANRVPNRDVDDEAFWNRWLTVIFPEAVPKNEQINDLDQTLLEESAGILNWAIEGYRRLMAQGEFTNEPLPFDNRRKWERYGNSIEQFIERYTESEEGASIPERSTDNTLGAYDSYVAFARQTGVECESKSKFTQEVTKRGDVVQRQRTVDGIPRTRCYVGITLTDDAPEPQSGSSDEESESRESGLGAYQ